MLRRARDPASLPGLRARPGAKSPSRPGATLAAVLLARYITHKTSPYDPLASSAGKAPRRRAQTPAPASPSYVYIATRDDPEDERPSLAALKGVGQKVSSLAALGALRPLANAPA